MLHLLLQSQHHGKQATLSGHKKNGLLNRQAVIFFFFQRSDLAGSNRGNAGRQIQCILGQCPAYVVDILLCYCCAIGGLLLLFLTCQSL